MKNIINKKSHSKNINSCKMHINKKQHKHKDIHSERVDHTCAEMVPIFSGLNHEELTKVNNLIKNKHYRKRSILFMQNDPANYLYIIHQGKVKLYEISKDGRQQIIRILEAGDFIGDLSLFTDENHSLSAETIVDTDICVISKTDFRNLVKQNPEITFNVTRILSKRLANAEKLIGELSLKSVEQRIASWIFIMARKNGVATSQGIRITINLSRQEIADLLGTTQETVSRKLTALQTEGIITIQGRKYMFIHDENKLKELESS